MVFGQVKRGARGVFDPQQQDRGVGRVQPAQRRLIPQMTVQFVDGRAVMRVRARAEKEVIGWWLRSADGLVRTCSARAPIPWTGSRPGRIRACRRCSGRARPRRNRRPRPGGPGTSASSASCGWAPPGWPAGPRRRSARCSRVAAPPSTGPISRSEQWTRRSPPRRRPRAGDPRPAARDLPGRRWRGLTVHLPMIALPSPCPGRSATPADVRASRSGGSRSRARPGTGTRGS